MTGSGARTIEENPNAGTEDYDNWDAGLECGIDAPATGTLVMMKRLLVGACGNGEGQHAKCHHGRDESVNGRPKPVSESGVGNK